MMVFLGLVIFVLLASILAGLAQVWRARRPEDRMLAAQLFTTASVAILLILSHMMTMPALLDVALVFALLAAVTVAAYIVLAGRRLQ